jgi:UDPglucose 6-dehydrogenase
MKICIYGLWHLGSVTAAHLARLGFDVIGCDPDPKVVDGLNAGGAPISEPGLDDLLKAGRDAGHLRFTTDLAQAARSCDVAWVTFDTPVNDQDEADVASVQKSIHALLKVLPETSVLVISSQVPVGFGRQLQKTWRRSHPRDVALAYSPENLRLGKALEVISHPDRIVVGLYNFADQSKFEPLFAKLSERIEWMSLESAEMTKHALNAFLATSVVFANEIATVCEAVGANAREVARGLLSESRIGSKAYLNPGAAFAGGTLARDVRFLIEQAKNFDLTIPLIAGIPPSNKIHQGWVRTRIKAKIPRLRGKKIAILGLTYKPGTDTLRRSWAIELATWLSRQGARVQAYDPLVSELPQELKKKIDLKATLPDALQSADGAVIATGHEVFRNLNAEALRGMKREVVIDPNGVAFSQLASLAPAVEYICVGFKSNGTAHE